MNQQFNKKKHAESLLEIECVLADMSLLCEGLDGVSSQMSGKQYINLAEGAIGLMAKALNEVYDIVSDAGSDYRFAHGIGYTDYQKKE